MSWKKNISGPIEWIKLSISELLLIIERELEVRPHDRVGLVFSNSNDISFDFCISFRPFAQYSTESILFEIEKVILSNMSFFTDDDLVINVDHVRMPVGYGNPRRNHIGKTQICVIRYIKDRCFHLY